MKKTFFSSIIIISIFTSTLFAQIDSISRIDPAQFLLEPDEDKLAETLRVSIANDSSSIRSYLMLGSLLENQLKFDEAETIYRKALAVDSTCAICFKQLAEIMVAKGMVRSAVNYYNQSLELDSTNSSARIQFARLLKRENRFKESLEQWSILLLSDSSNFYILEQIGDCSLRIGQIGLAWSAYLGSYYSNPKNLPIAVKIGQMGIQQSIPPPFFESIIDSALRVDSLYIPLLKVKGSMHFNAKNYQETIDIYQKAIEQGDSSRVTFKHIGMSLHMKKRFEESERYLEKAYQIDSSDVISNFFYAKTLNNVGEPTRALDVLKFTEQLMVPGPEEHATIYEERCTSYLLNENVELAIAQLIRAYEINPSKPEYLISIADLYEVFLNDLKTALEYNSQFLVSIDKFKEQNVDVTKYEWDIQKTTNSVKRLKETLFFKDEL